MKIRMFTNLKIKLFDQLRRSKAFTATKAKRFGIGVENTAEKALEIKKSSTFIFGSYVLGAGVSWVLAYEHIVDQGWLSKTREWELNDRSWLEMTRVWELEERKKKKAVFDEAEKIEAGKKVVSDEAQKIEAGKKAASEAGKKEDGAI